MSDRRSNDGDSLARLMVRSLVPALVGALLATAGYVLPLDRRLSVLEQSVADLRADVAQHWGTK